MIFQSQANDFPFCGDCFTERHRADSVMYFHRISISANRPAETATDTLQRLQASVALYIVLHKQVLPVEYGVSELRNPVAQNQDTARTGQHQVQLDVAMAENEEVYIGMRLSDIPWRKTTIYSASSP